MTTAFDTQPEKLIEEMAKDLKENVKFKKPEWAEFVKTGAQNERAPEDLDWWWERAASVLRKVYVYGPIGTQKLRVMYGGRKNRGRKPEEFRKAGGKIIRAILMQYDELGFTEKDAKTKTGRKITAKGRSYVDKIASKIAQKNV